MEEYLNYYACYSCKHEWRELWSCACDSTCPKCGARNVQVLAYKRLGPPFFRARACALESDG